MFEVNEIIKNSRNGDLRVVCISTTRIRNQKGQLESSTQYDCVNSAMTERISFTEQQLSHYKRMGELEEMLSNKKWQPKKGELIWVWDSVENNKKQREFFSMDGDGFVCKSNKNNDLFYSWKYASVVTAEMPDVPKGMFSVAGYEYGMGLETGKIVRGRLFYFARQNWYIGFFSTSSITNLTYGEIKKKSEHKEGCFYFRGDPMIEEKRNDKSRYRMFINGRYYFANTQNDIISCEVIGDDLVETYEIVKKG